MPTSEPPKRYRKAAEILTGGGCLPYHISAEGKPRGIAAVVTGSHGRYKTMVYYDARGKLVRRCSCDWSTIYHPVAADCAHVLAVQTLVTGESLDEIWRKA